MMSEGGPRERASTIVVKSGIPKIIEEPNFCKNCKESVK